jgi:hypothetical protein
MSKSVKVWLLVLTFWQGLLTLVIIILARTPSQYETDTKSMFTSWSGNHLNIGCVTTDQFFVTHLKDVARHSFAELPKPLLVASSGGVMIPQSDLAKLTWIVPPDAYDSAFPTTTNYVVAAPAVGSQIEAIYQFPANARFREK